VAQERRSGSERRITLRRAGRRRRRFDRRVADRREPSPSAYTREEVALIRKLLTTHRLPFLCPRCDGLLAMGSPIAREGSTIRTVRCTSCRRSVSLADYSVARILVVDEDERAREVLRTILGIAGHEVVALPDANAALRSCRHNPADVIFVDVTPGTGAVAFLRQCRKEFPKATMVAIGGRPRYAAGDPLLVASRLGAQYALRKPFAPHDVLRTLDDALGLARAS
jgi:CheY-like chemotaxis protein